MSQVYISQFDILDTENKKIENCRQASSDSPSLPWARCSFFGDYFQSCSRSFKNGVTNVKSKLYLFIRITLYVFVLNFLLFCFQENSLIHYPAVTNITPVLIYVSTNKKGILVACSVTCFIFLCLDSHNLYYFFIWRKYPVSRSDIIICEIEKKWKSEQTIFQE